MKRILMIAVVFGLGFSVSCSQSTGSSDLKLVKRYGQDKFDEQSKELIDHLRSTSMTFAADISEDDLKQEGFILNHAAMLDYENSGELEARTLVLYYLKNEGNVETFKKYTIVLNAPVIVPTSDKSSHERLYSVAGYKLDDNYFIEVESYSPDYSYLENELDVPEVDAEEMQIIEG